MFCPRCGTQNPETTKFCRQCGLGLASLTGYVATGGTGALTGPPSSMSGPMAAPPVPIQLPETSEMLALKQKRAMTILACAILPVVLTIIGEEAFNVGDILAATFLLIPLGITWAIYHYKTQLRRLQEEQMRQYYAGAPQSGYAPPMPAFQAPPAQPQLAPPPTNRFHVAAPGQGSVIEDETRKLPIERQ